MARQKRSSPTLDDGNTRAAALTTAKTKLDSYNGLLSQVDDTLNGVEAAEKTVSDLYSCLLSGMKTKFGADSSQYEAVGGTRSSEIKRAARKPVPTAKSAPAFLPRPLFLRRTTGFLLLPDQRFRRFIFSNCVRRPPLILFRKPWSFAPGISRCSR